MRLATKTLLSVLVASIINAGPTAYRKATQRQARRYERILEKHDRKGEVRAAVLGMTSVEFREQERRKSLSDIVKAQGFTDKTAFYGAMVAKLHEELRCRGWTVHRIRQFETTRLARVV